MTIDSWLQAVTQLGYRLYLSLNSTPLRDSNKKEDGFLMNTLQLSDTN